MKGPQTQFVNKRDVSKENFLIFAAVFLLWVHCLFLLNGEWFKISFVPKLGFVGLRQAKVMSLQPWDCQVTKKAQSDKENIHVYPKRFFWDTFGKQEQRFLFVFMSRSLHLSSSAKKRRAWAFKSFAILHLAYIERLKTWFCILWKRQYKKMASEHYWSLLFVLWIISLLVINCNIVEDVLPVFVRSDFFSYSAKFWWKHTRGGTTTKIFCCGTLYILTYVDFGCQK